MEHLAETMTDFLLRRKYITEEQTEWCHYMRKLRDERGNIYWGIDEDIRDRLRSRLMRAVLSFKV